MLLSLFLSFPALLGLTFISVAFKIGGYSGGSSTQVSYISTAQKERSIIEYILRKYSMEVKALEHKDSIVFLWRKGRFLFSSTIKIFFWAKFRQIHLQTIVEYGP